MNKKIIDSMSYIKKELTVKKLPLGRGKRSTDVLKVQQWLQLHDVYTVTDGIYGPATARCVELFQSQSNLSVTGVVNRKTWEALIAPMKKALAKPWKEKPATLAEAVLWVANQHLDNKPMELGTQNLGPWVRLYCDGNDGVNWPWCAGFVSFIVRQACWYLDESMPFEGSVSCDVLSAQAKEVGFFVSGKSIIKGRYHWLQSEVPRAAIFLRKRSDNDWDHTGFVKYFSDDKKDSYFFTLEGNTNAMGGREGYKACCKVRSLMDNNYDFIVFN